MKDILFTKDVAEMLQVHRHQVERMANEGTIPFFVLPGMKQRRFRREAIEVFIREQEQNTGPNVVPFDQTKRRKKPTTLAPFRQGQKSRHPRKHEWRRAFRRG